MPTIFYLVLIWFTYLDFTWGWFLISVLFSLVSGGRKRRDVYYQYTGDIRLDSEAVEPQHIDKSKFM